MANKYDIIHIDFQASARGANAAIESIRTEAQKTSDKISALKKSIEEGVAAKMDQHSLDGMRSELKSYEKRYKQLTQAQNELIKGMRVLDEGVKQFNSGALSQMNAAFQKSVNNAAKLAQSKMTTGTKEWREMGAIMQETEQNYARMQRDTDQLIENLQNGGTVFRKTLEDEKKGLNDLLQVLPYMGTEYRKAEEQLQILVKTTDEMIIKERQLKGEIVTTNDARRVRMQLTKEGAEAARQAADAAQVEIDKGKQQIEILEKQQTEIEARAKASAEAAAKYTEDLQMYDDYIEELDREIDKDKKAAKQRKEKAEDLRKEADEAKKNAEAQREAQKIIDQAVETSAAKVENLKQQLKDLKSGQKEAAESAKESAEAKKEDTAATEQQAEAEKKNTEAKKEQVQVEANAAQAVQKEQLSEDALTAAIAQQKAELEKLEAEKKAIIAAQEESAKATNAEAEAYKNLTKEQAEAKLKEKQALATFKNEGGKWQVTNREEAQQFIFDALGEIEPSYVGKTKIDGIGEQSTQLMSKFKERYGMKSEDEAMGAIRELMSGGGLIKQGGINKFFVAVEQDTKKVDAYRNEIKALTDIVKGETKAVEENTEKKRTLEEVEAEIAAVEKQQSATVKQLRALREGDIKITDEGTKKTGEEAEAKKKNVEATNAEIEAIKKLSKEKAQAMKAEMTNPSKVGYKGGKLDASNIEEVQSFIVSRMKKIESRNKKGDVLSLGGDQVDRLVKDFQERYGFVGEPKKAKDLLKQIVSAGGGLFKGGGQADFSQFGSFIVNLDSGAYEARLAKLKELVKITSDTTQATDKLGEATKKGTEASKESAKATGDQSAAINEQIEKVNQRYEAYQAKEKEYNEKMAELEKKRKAKSNLPKSGADALLQRSQLDDEIKDYNENVVAPARRERNKMKNLWESSAQKLAEMQGLEQEAPKRTRRKAKATEDDTKAVEENTKATENNTKAKKDNAKASQEEAERKAKEAEIKKQLADAEKELTDAQKKQKEEQSKTTKMDREAENLQNKAHKAEGEAGGKAEEYLQEQNKMKQEREQLMADNKNTLKDNETNQKQLADINEKLKEQTDRIRENEQIKAQANTQGIEKTEQAIRLLQDENRRIDTNSDKWKENTKDIQALQAALDEMKGKPALMMMEERMGNIKNLSAAALTETKKFWEAMAAGASKGSAELKTAEANLKAIANEESKRNKASLKTKAGRLDNMGRYSEGEVRESIDAAKQLIQTYKVGGKDATELAKKIVDAEEYIKKYGLEAARTAQREADAIAEANKRRQESDDIMRKQLGQGTELSESALKAQQQYWQHLIDDPKTAAESIEAYKKELEKVQEIQRQQEDATRNERAGRIGSASNLGDYSESEIREAIEATKQLMQAVNTSDEKYKQYGQSIATAEEYLRKYGLEAQRAALREEAAMTEQIKKEEELRNMMKLRLKDLSTLSASALEETKKYWDAQYNGATKGSKAMIEAERALRDIANIEKRQSSERAAGILDNTGRYGVADIKSAIQDMERLRDSVTHGGLEWTKYNRYVEQGKKYLDDLAHTDALQKMNTNMQNLTTLSSAALSETKKFWETMAAGASKGSAELKTAEANLKAITDLEKERANTANKDKADVLLRGTLQNYSEREIREAIEAAKAFRNELATGDKDAERYAEAIAKAEAHIKKYGVETARAAQKQKENDDLMRAQLTRMFNDMYTGAGMPSESQLKAQKQYWQRIIDDPKTAASSLNEYRNALADVEKMEADMVKIGGQTALAWFGQGGDKNASENQIKEMAAKLKEYRGTLLKETNADEINQIDAILQKVGVSAKKAAEELMDFDKAKELALQAGDDIYGKKNPAFLASPEEIQAATKSIEKYREELFKTIKTKREAGQATDAEEQELQELAKYLKDLKFEQDNFNMSREKMEELMKTPTNAINLDELRTAIKRADAELKRMEGSLGDNSEEYKNFAAQVKNAKGVLKEMEGQAKATTSAWEKAWSRLKTYVGMYMGFNMAWQRITGTADDLMELSDKLGEVRKTTGFTADEVGRLSDNLKKMDTRTTINGLLDLSVAAGQLGLKTEQDVQGFVEAANKLMVALPEMGQEGATQMLKVALATGEITKIQKQMDEGLVEGSSATAVAMEKVASTIDRLRATSAATAPAITDFVKRVGAVGAQSGISIDQIAALGSTVDALGLRVEMSATALSRMIPAIRNNAFDVAKAIGVTPESLRNLFDTGRGMEAILMIFQHIKDAGMDEDSIEQMLGMGNMKEIMKELNQQGARAGIVFAGLSQNVDELRKHLVTASEAYEENIAIQSEYEKMNETTMAKWIRLKNQLEEMFVGDAAQRTLGVIIDGLRWIVDFISGNLNPVLNATSAFIKAIGVAWAVAYSGMGAGLKSVFMWVTNLDVNIKKLTASLKAFYAANKANVWMAAAAAVFYLGLKIRDAFQEVNGLAKALVDAESNLATMTRAVGELFSKYTQVTEKQRELTRSTNKLKEREAALKEETEALRKSLGDGAEKSDKFKKKQDELAKAHEEVAKAEGEAAKETNKRSALISEINSKYGTYLGYMLSEASTAETVASAHDLIIAALKEEMYWKEKNQSFETVKKQHEETLKDYREAALNEMSGVDVMRQQNIMSAWQAQLTKVKYDAKAGGFVIPGFSEAFSTLNEAVEGMKEVFNSVLQNKGGYYLVHPDDQQARLEDWWGQSGFGGFTDRGFKDWTRESLKVIQEAATLQSMSGSAAEAAHESAVQKAVENTNALIKQAQEAGVGGRINNNKKVAEAIVGIQKNLSKYGELSSTFTQFGDNSLESVGKELLKYQTEAQRKAIMDEVQRVAANGVTPVKPPKPTKDVWGTTPSAESTDYGTWDVDELVARRNQMDKFKNILKPDTDVKAVLAEDKALMKALQNGLSSDWKSVMNWYNQERLKIQEELKSERFSTNQGHWRDEKNGRGRRNRFRESDYALAELDRYYSKRKEELEKARIEENMSEELFNRQAELLEQEHLERRSKLRETFTAGETKEEQEMVKKFREWWENLEKQGLLDDVPWKTVESEWSKALASDIGRNNLKAQQDLTQLQQITVKHLNKIADIIAKERPYDGIVDNLRKNLTEMDILLGDIQKQGPTADPATLVQEQNKRLQFLLGEAENAYSTTVEDVLRRMADAGMTAWADEISKSDAMKNALMAQLQKAYDEIQNAIKKEASDIKKQTDIWWNDLVPGQEQSRKGGFEKMLSSLGLQEDQVKRANQLISAGAASERVADKLAIKQMQLRLQMQQTYYNKMRQMWADRIAALRAQGKEIDAQHAEISKQLSLSEEQKKLDEQRVAIANQLEESQNRLYTQLKEWGDLLASSVREMMEATHAGDAEYYNELAKLNLTGKGGPGAGTYIVIDNEGTEDATAHYEYLDERAALERQHEIERQNAEAEAWKKVMDDINNKMNEQITDWMNAFLQNQSIDMNTTAVDANTLAVSGLTEQLAQGIKINNEGGSPFGNISAEKEAVYGGNEDAMNDLSQMEDLSAMKEQYYMSDAYAKMNADDMYTERAIANSNKRVQVESANDKKIQTGTQSAFAKMTAAANLYGIAYQAMSNDNLSTTQKFEMIAVQAAGQAAISALTASLAQNTGQVAADTPAVASKTFAQLGPIAGPAAFAAITALLGGLLGFAVSKITKSKSQIAQVTGASMNAGRLSTGMLTYAKGNVNEFTDPASLTPGRSYNVDGADGKTYRAKYTGKNPSTHITNGPEFHLAGEKGREMIIDAGTTRQITMNDNEIWQAIKTLSGGGRVQSRRSMRRGVKAFADGNVDEFETIDSGAAAGELGFDPTAMQASLDKNNELLERALTNGIKGVFNVYGKDGLIDSYDTGKKNVTRHGERY